MPDDVFDLLVIGGGVNGAGIAADASSRGLRVLLAEAGDLAGATSSASSKLIHGGLRYLEHYEFRLVREALAEREVLLAKAPHIIWPMRFILPHISGMRPRWMMRAGLFLYDHLAARKTLAGSTTIDLRRDAAGAPLRSGLETAYSYADCWVDDARLVVLNAIAAREAGASVLTRTPVRGLRPEDGKWVAALGDGRRVLARAVANAAGPWVGDVARLAHRSNDAALPTVRLVKGSHIVVPRIAGANDAYTFQNRDGRVVFALPFETDFTLIGTTEQPQVGDPRDVAATEDEKRYLLDVISSHFKQAPTRDQIVWSFAGVRPLDDDGSESASAVSRDYRLQLDGDGGVPILHVIGGKITTYRKLAEAALALLEPFLKPARPGATSVTPLPGGDLRGDTFETWFDAFAAQKAGFDRAYLLQLARRYGSRAARVIDNATSVGDMGADLGGGLTQRETAYLKSEEMAETAEDVLWRRTKTGLRIQPADRPRTAQSIQDYMDKL